MHALIIQFQKIYFSIQNVKPMFNFFADINADINDADVNL